MIRFLFRKIYDIFENLELDLHYFIKLAKIYDILENLIKYLQFY